MCREKEVLCIPNTRDLSADFHGSRLFPYAAEKVPSRKTAIGRISRIGNRMFARDTKTCRVSSRGWISSNDLT